MSDCGVYKRIGEDLKNCIQKIEKFKFKTNDTYLQQIYEFIMDFEEHTLEDYADADILRKSLYGNNHSKEYISQKKEELKKIKNNLETYLKKESASELNLEYIESFLEKWKNRCFSLKETAEGFNHFNTPY